MQSPGQGVYLHEKVEIHFSDPLRGRVPPGPLHRKIISVNVAQRTGFDGTSTHAGPLSKTFSVPRRHDATNSRLDEEPSGATKGLTPGQKEVIASLVSYQQGSVVSRTIISDSAGTVTLFAFDEGEGLSEHAAPYDALLHLLEGEAEITISGKMNRLEQGEAIILPAGKPHAVRASRKFKMLLTMIRSK
jgi:quercetin dioxygenase-like cupin family protein